MRTRKLELLRPEEIASEREKNHIIYLPLGLIEWHSYAMPLGTDAIVSERACLAAAEKTGGVVHPVLYIAPKLVRDDGRKAMESADSCAKSMLFSDDLFELAVWEYAQMFIRQGYKGIYFIVGHGSAGYTDVIDNICERLSDENGVTVRQIHAWYTQDVSPYSAGHATIIETSLMMYLTDSVDLDRLPPYPEKLPCRKFGFDDPREDAEGCVNDTDDPRKATEELGRFIFLNGVDNIVEAVDQYSSYL